MLECEVRFEFIDGSVEKVDFPADLDYLNVRQWRLLWLNLCKHNKDDVCRLVIQPKNRIIF